MLTYNMDVEERSTWLRATPGAAALAQPFYCTEAGNFYGRAHFATARTDKESYLLFYTLSGSGLIEQNDQRVELPAGSALLLNCRTPQSYCTAPGQDHWHHYWAHLDGAGVANLAEVLQPQGRLSPVTVSRLEMQPLFESLAAEWEHGAAAQIEICLALHRMLALMARQLLAGDESRSNRTLIEQAAEYIRQHYAEPLSLDSLLAQTWQELEIIVVDDGSPDNSWGIMQEYARRDSRVRPIRQKNGGLSAARTLNGSCENFVPDKKRLTKRTKNAIFFL